MNIKLVALIVLLVAAVAGVLILTGQQPQPAAETARNPVAAAPVEQAALPTEVTVYKSPTCGCCGQYEKYLAENGFQVKSVPTETMADFKHEHGIPHDMQSCHTALIVGYFVEGHVPVEAIRALLTQQPAVDGIALPGMPMGSPGMGGEKSEPFKIYSITNGVAELFMSL